MYCWQTLMNVYHLHVVKSVQTLLVVINAFVMVVMSWTVMGELAMVQLTATNSGRD